VLLREAIEGLAIRPGGLYLDGTLGGGGHARAILDRAAPGGRLVVMDRDAGAWDRARPKLEGAGTAVTWAPGNFRDMAAVADRLDLAAFDGILLDLGISSDQLDAPERGFSFQADGPLDMRMDSSQGRTAADLMNTLDEAALETLFRRYGEEPDARRLARAAVAERVRAPFSSTRGLAEWVARIKGGRAGRLHPATRVFQALRIAVNDELGALEAGLEAALGLLAPGGRLAVIAFHSLEDRLVKACFRRHAGHWENLQAGGRRWVGDRPRVRCLTRKPETPSEQEQNENPRSRSAKLRIAERIREDESWPA